jgi:CRISPR-associated endonuclease/helicase Cas3
LWAHSPSDQNPAWHRLDDHLRGTAALARGFGEAFGCGDLAWWTGLIHDGGKAFCDWQARLAAVAVTGARVGIDHKSYGVQLARAHGLQPVEWAVAGHHGGLTRRDEVDELFGEDDDAERARDLQWTDVERQLKQLVPEIFSAAPAIPAHFPPVDTMSREFLVRFLFSCLVDADGLDTRAHRLGHPVRLGLELAADQLLERFLDRRDGYLAGRAPAPMDGLRETVFADALAAAGDRPGLFRLTAPTGAAKTLAAAAFALKHAAAHGRRRVIVAVPFITITEQNADVYRRLLDDIQDGQPVVLEHHSNVDVDSAATPAHQLWARQAAENWDAPFVVTTTVQLLESLFGRRPSQMRKVHRIANSVIVLDEVQALPHRLLPQVADALRILTQRFNVTALLSSATQPELWALGPLRNLPLREIVCDPAASFQVARRVRFRWMTDPKPDLAAVVRDAATHDQVLMVVNTIRDARRAYTMALAAVTADTTVLHLSTGMCAAHRRRVLAAVKATLAAREPLFLVSTSLVEAGVDLDFPVAYRAVAPPESIAQVAGRCNREGLLGPEAGLVVIFDASDGGAPASYQTQVDKAQQYFGPGKADPEDLDALREYFPDLYRTLGVEDRTGVAEEIRRNRQRWDFRAVANGPLRRGSSNDRDRSRAFRLINDETVTVVVPYGDDERKRQMQSCMHALRGSGPDPVTLRLLQPQMTTVRQQTARRADVAALLVPVIGDLFEWRGRYDDGFGLVLDPEGEDFIL